MDHMLENSPYAIASSEETQQNCGYKMSIIGASESADRIRKDLNQMDLSPYKHLVEDGGNIVGGHTAEFCRLLPEILEAQVFMPVLIANEKYHDSLQAAMTHENWISGVVDRSYQRYTDSDKTDYNRYIGIQKHFGTSHENMLSLDQIVRLSEVRYNNQKAEVALRNVDTAFINLDALRSSDNIGHKGSWSAGMTIEEMCQVAKYIGASINLKGVVIGGYSENQDHSGIISKNISLILWYMMEGFQIRSNESSTDNTNSFNTYTVFTDNLENELTFRENKQSGRWWLEIPELDEYNRNTLLPCSKQDYEEACVNKISDKIMKIYSRI